MRFKKILLFILIFLGILFIKNNVFAITYDSDYYVELKITDGRILRICSSQDNFYLYPEPAGNGEYYICSRSIDTNEPVLCNVYVNGYQNYENVSSQFWGLYPGNTLMSQRFTLYSYKGNIIIYDNYDMTEIFFSSVETYIAPYIADNDDVLSNLDTYDNILIFPR